MIRDSPKGNYQKVITKGAKAGALEFRRFLLCAHPVVRYFCPRPFGGFGGSPPCRAALLSLELHVRLSTRFGVATVSTVERQARVAWRPIRANSQRGSSLAGHESYAAVRAFAM